MTRQEKLEQYQAELEDAKWQLIAISQLLGFDTTLGKLLFAQSIANTYSETAMKQLAVDAIKERISACEELIQSLSR